MRNVVWVLGAALLIAAANVAYTAVRSVSYPAYWRDRAREPVPDGAIRLVALGDSSVQAIGADRPMDGYVGRIAEYVTARTGRPVHISNVATATKVAGILRDELPLVDLSTADIVIATDTNDMESRVPLNVHRANLGKLLDLLPAARTIVSDLPPFPGREPYQEILAELADARGIMRADAHGALTASRRLDIFSWLPPHLNSNGYALWFEAFRPKVDELIGSLPGR